MISNPKTHFATEFENSMASMRKTLSKYLLMYEQTDDIDATVSIEMLRSVRKDLNEAIAAARCHDKLEDLERQFREEAEKSAEGKE